MEGDGSKNSQVRMISFSVYNLNSTQRLCTNENYDFIFSHLFNKTLFFSWREMSLTQFGGCNSVGVMALLHAKKVLKFMSVTWKVVEVKFLMCV
jgi:hypothetical protein